jgi:hypothetical protein
MPVHFPQAILLTASSIARLSACPLKAAAIPISNT